MKASFWSGKRVLLTGHTGFKGGWLSLWLAKLGANVYGYSLSPIAGPNLFEIAKVGDYIEDQVFADIRDANALKKFLKSVNPEIVFHLAAQPLVSASYDDPFYTYSVNIMGTVNLFEVIRSIDSVEAIINITTDKVYENKEWLYPYRENDALGGFDPYSNSKACSDLITSSYRQSYFEKKQIAIASARAGNVFGGGDWTVGRLIPDIFNSLRIGSPVFVRSLHSVRPWQHVLEPISGYLDLAQELSVGTTPLPHSLNFGPKDDDFKTVEWILKFFQGRGFNLSWVEESRKKYHESKLLRVDSTNARHHLGWTTKWDIETALIKTSDWHESWLRGEDMALKCQDQISQYEKL